MYPAYHISDMAGNASYVEQLISFIKEGSEHLSPGIEDRIRMFAIRKSDEKKTMANLGQLSFGKYSGKTIDEIASFDAGYIKWLAKNDKYCPETIRKDIERVIALA
jgi:uncharacterized protein (DUF3820 family)